MCPEGSTLGWEAEGKGGVARAGRVPLRAAGITFKCDTGHGGGGGVCIYGRPVDP